MSRFHQILACLGALVKPEPPRVPTSLSDCHHPQGASEHPQPPRGGSSGSSPWLMVASTTGEN